MCTALCPIFLGLSLSFYGVGHVSTAEKVALSWALGKLKQTNIKTVHLAEKGSLRGVAESKNKKIAEGVFMPERESGG